MRKWGQDILTTCPSSSRIPYPFEKGLHLRRQLGLRLRLRQHGLIKKIAGKHRYYLTKTGAGSLIAARQLTERLIIPSLAAA